MSQEFRAEYAGVIAEAICYDLKDAVDKIAIVGGLRRKRPVVLGVSILYISKVFQEVKADTQGDLFSGYSKNRSVKNIYAVEVALPTLDYLEYRLGEDGKPVTPVKHPFRCKALIDKPTKVLVDLYPVLAEGDWGTAMALRTGPSKFTMTLTNAALSRGYELLGIKLTKSTDHATVLAPTEEEFFELCGVKWIEPEKR